MEKGGKRWGGCCVVQVGEILWDGCRAVGRSRGWCGGMRSNGEERNAILIGTER